MTKKKTTTVNLPLPNPSLVVSRTEATSKLMTRIDLGKKILDSQIQNQADYDQLKAEKSKWDSFNLELLRRIFDNESIADEYHRAPSWGAMYVNMNFHDSVKSCKDGLKNKIGKLESITERLELIPELNGSATEFQPSAGYSNKNVFIVHGHDEAAKVNVARFLEKLGLNPIILHEQANKGRTIIEKFEAHASDVGFAIVLLTPDDIGAAREAADNLKERARQNVILELGYFCGSLGRNRVCVLYKEGVEIPNDYLGVIYTLLDNSGGWNFKLAKELKEAGLDFDMNRAF